MFLSVLLSCSFVNVQMMFFVNVQSLFFANLQILQNVSILVLLDAGYSKHVFVTHELKCLELSSAVNVRLSMIHIFKLLEGQCKIMNMFVFTLVCLSDAPVKFKGS